MKLSQQRLNDLASILYAFEDPDSYIPFLNQQSKEFKEELKAKKLEYEGLLIERKAGLKQAVGWLLCQDISNNEKLNSLVPDFYRRIWIHH